MKKTEVPGARPEPAGLTMTVGSFFPSGGWILASAARSSVTFLRRSGSCSVKPRISRRMFSNSTCSFVAELLFSSCIVAELVRRFLIFSACLVFSSFLSCSSLSACTFSVIPAYLSVFSCCTFKRRRCSCARSISSGVRPCMRWVWATTSTTMINTSTPMSEQRMSRNGISISSSLRCFGRLTMEGICRGI